MSQKLSMLEFEKEQIGGLISNLGFKLKKENNKEIVINQDGEIQKCFICEKKITKENVGSVAHGSNHLFCDNPLCFLSYLEKQR
ncbi:MAG: hypothetical protein ABIE94_02745 [archaeon]